MTLSRPGEEICREIAIGLSDCGSGCRSKRIGALLYRRSLQALPSTPYPSLSGSLGNWISAHSAPREIARRCGSGGLVERTKPS